MSWNKFSTFPLYSAKGKKSLINKNIKIKDGNPSIKNTKANENTNNTIEEKTKANNQPKKSKDLMHKGSITTKTQLTITKKT
jgi:hypothetical protein